MSWLFSKALMDVYGNSPSSPGRVAEYSQVSCSGGEPSAPLSVMPTPHKFWRNDKTMEACDLSRFGLTCAVLTESRGVELLTSYLAAFPVRTFPRQAKERGLKVNAPDSGKSSRGSFAKYSRDSRSWKTHQFSLLGGLIEFSETWPRWGSMRDGAAYRLPTPSGLLAHRAWITNAREFGSSVPTPNVPSGGRVVGADAIWTSNCTAYKPDGKKIQVGLESFVRLPTPTASTGGAEGERPGRTNGPKLATAVRLPTPRGMDGAKGAVSATNTTKQRVSDGTANLPEFIQETLRLPTPHGFSPDGRSNGPSGNELGRAVNRMPTPIHSEARQGMQIRRDGAKGTQTSLTTEVGGSLNPPWVEWLMGWPIGWTDLKALETGKFQQWLRLHGGC